MIGLGLKVARRAFPGDSYSAGCSLGGRSLKNPCSFTFSKYRLFGTRGDRVLVHCFYGRPYSGVCRGSHGW